MSQYLGHRLRVAHVFGVGVEGAALHRGSQHIAVAVIDGAALGLKHLGIGMESLGLLGLMGPSMSER